MGNTENHRPGGRRVLHAARERRVWHAGIVPLRRPGGARRSTGVRLRRSGARSRSMQRAEPIPGWEEAAPGRPRASFRRRRSRRLGVAGGMAPLPRPVAHATAVAESPAQTRGRALRPHVIRADHNHALLRVRIVRLATAIRPAPVADPAIALDDSPLPLGVASPPQSAVGDRPFEAH